jgi:hypothetical protein
VIARATRELVRTRAQERCEYCGLAEIHSPLARLQIEHVRPRKHGGSDDPANLALACIDCNLRKGANLTGIDPITGSVTVLFNPRSDVWTEHFTLVGVRIHGQSDVGRATVAVLELNSADRLQLRVATYRR